MNGRRWNKALRAGFLMLGAALMVPVWVVSAQTFATPQAAIEFRHQAYEKISDDLEEVADLLKSGGAGALPQVQQRAAGLVETVQSLPAAFPPGSSEGETRARRMIWREWEDFSQRLERLETALVDMEQAAGVDDLAATQAAFKEAAASCRSCHLWYRTFW
ncbi:MAG: cytochrome c [Pseudomonadota bacterium]|nr:cytochrome c [Pseudomonadota bacterium]